MKGGICDNISCNSKTFDFRTDFYKLDKLELMKEKLKSQIMLFYTHKYSHESIYILKFMD